MEELQLESLLSGDIMLLSSPEGGSSPPHQSLQTVEEDMLEVEAARSAPTGQVPGVDEGHVPSRWLFKDTSHVHHNAIPSAEPDVELPGVEELVAAAVAASEAAEAEEARDEDEGPLLGEPVVQDFARRSWAPSPKTFPAEYLGGDFHRSFGLHHCLASSLLRAGDILECCGIRAVLTAEGKIKCGTRLFPTPSPFVNACCKSTKRGSERSKRNGWGKTTPVLVLSYEKGRRGQPISLFDVRATFMKLAAGQLTSEESWDVDVGLLEQVADGGSAGTRSSSRLRKKKKSHEDDE